MTTYIPFQPQPNSSPPFQATITLDSASYNLVAIWNIYRGGYYVTITAQDGTVEWTGAMVGSPPSANIYLAPGVFSASTILWRPGTGNIETNP
ncbi:MAG: phage baseplate plug family protein [Gemmatimonadaceae bacterium]